MDNLGTLDQAHDSLEKAKEMLGDYVMRFVQRNWYNYRTYLTGAKKIFEESLDVFDNHIKRRQKRIKSLEAKIEKLNDEVSALRVFKRNTKGGIKAIGVERSYRQKMNRLAKKYLFLFIDYQGDDDVYTTWVYSDDFRDEHEPTGYSESDPYCDNHFCDSYEEAYERCLEYIKEEKQ